MKIAHQTERKNQQNKHTKHEQRQEMLDSIRKQTKERGNGSSSPQNTRSLVPKISLKLGASNNTKTITTICQDFAQNKTKTHSNQIRIRALHLETQNAKKKQHTSSKKQVKVAEPNRRKTTNRNSANKT